MIFLIKENGVKNIFFMVLLTLSGTKIKHVELAITMNDVPPESYKTLHYKKTVLCQIVLVDQLKVKAKTNSLWLFLFLLVGAFPPCNGVPSAQIGSPSGGN